MWVLRMTVLMWCLPLSFSRLVLCACDGTPPPPWSTPVVWMVWSVYGTAEVANVNHSGTDTLKKYWTLIYQGE